MQKNPVFISISLVLSLFLACQNGHKTQQTGSQSGPDSSQPTVAKTAAEADSQLKTGGGQLPGQPGESTRPMTQAEMAKALEATPNTADPNRQKINPPKPPDPGKGVPTVQTKKLSASKMAFLTEQNFMFTSATGAKMAEYVKNKWLVFKPDQTLEIYQDKLKIDGGRWAYDEANDIVFLSCKDKTFNNSWKTQSFGKNLLLLGNTDLNATGQQFRMYMTTYAPGEIPESMLKTTTN